MLWSSVRSLPRACLLSLLLAATQTVAVPAAAQTANAALLDEAEKLSDRAHELDGAGNTSAAIEAMQRSLALQEQKLMPQLPEAARPLFRVELTEAKLFLVALYLKADDVAHAVELLEAEIRFHESLTSGDRFAQDVDGWRAALPKLRQNALVSQVKQAILLHEQDRDSEALLILRKVLPELDRAEGVDPANLAAANLIAGRVLAQSLAYAEAEARYLRALDYGEQLFGRDGSQLLGVLGELGQLGITRGLPERGAKYLVRAHALAQAHGSPELPSTVKDLGVLLWHRHDYAAATQVLTRALELYSTQQTPSARMGMLATRLYLASVQDDAGKPDDAESSYVTLGKEVDGMLAGMPALAGLQAVYLRSYGVHHLRQGHYQRAEELLLKAAAVSKTLMPADSPAVVQQGCDLGEVFWAAGDLERSLEPIGRCFDSREQDIARVLATGTEEQKRAFLGSYLVAYQKTMNAQRLGGNANAKLNRLALTQVLRTKGRVLDAMTSSGLSARAAQSQATRELMQRLTGVRAGMAKLASSGLGSAQDLRRLSDEAAGIEAKLTETDAGYRAATQTIDIASVQAKLASPDVLFEIVQYRPLDAHYRKAEPELRYLAYVLHHDGEPQAFDLGEARVIDAAVAKLRGVLSHPEKDVLPAARELYRLVVKPALAGFRDKKHVFVAPDGALSGVPFAALVGQDGFLVENYDFTYLTSGRELLHFGVETPASGPIVAFANPTFGDAPGKPQAGATALARAVFPALPGTQAEAEALKRLFPDAVVHTGSDASEAKLKKVSRPFALHLATHGFFLPVQSLSNMSGRNGEALDAATAGERLAVAGNPLLRSGLAFAGATGLRGKDGEDGVLTALEASSLDLTGTQLVVLSACQTAEGEVSQGEGVYGLRRALTVAGAEALVMSLWSVDDEATSYLMRGYYRRLKEGSGRSEALQSVQIVLERAPATHHPYYWAAFIPSGNPGPIVVPAAIANADSTPTSSSSTSSSGSSEPSSDSSEDESWPTATPSLAASLGGARLTLDPTDARPTRQGYQAYASLDCSAASAGWSEDFGNESRGFVIYDRLGASLAAFTVNGDSLAALHADYSFLFGYRARRIGLFGGARYGSGTIVVTDGPKNTGSYFPLAARLELQWFWDSRISAVGYKGALFGKREVMGLDVRIPLLDPTFWLQTGFIRTSGKPGQNSEAMMVPVSLGFSE